MKANFFPIILLVFILGTSCSANQKTGITTLTPEAFANKIAETTNPQIIDVRTPEEYIGGAIEDAQNVNWNSADFNSKIELLDKTRPVFVYCLSGGRSAEASQTLVDKGFKEIFELQGGIMAWNNAGLPLANAVKKSSGLTQEEYTELVTEDGYVLVDFSAEWCGPCKKLAPIVAEIEQEYKGKVKVIRIDVDENPEISQALQVSSIPLLHLYKKGQLVWENVGLTEKAVITKELK
jgi:thioredoxin